MALQRWLICGPEISRLLEEFEGVPSDGMNEVRDHHDSSESVQLNFHKDVKSLLLALEDAGNPFEDDSNDLFDLETKIVVPEVISQNLYKLESIGSKQFRDFLDKRVYKRSIPLSDTINKNK